MEFIKFSPKEGFDYSTSQVDVEGYAKSLKLKDTNLINFRKYSKNTYETHAYKSIINRLYLAEEFTDEENKKIS